MNTDDQNEKIVKAWGSTRDAGIEFKPPLLTKHIDDESFNEYEKAISDFVANKNDLIEQARGSRAEYEKQQEKAKRPVHTSNAFFYGLWVVFLVVLEIPTNYSTIEQFLHKPVRSMLVTIAIGVMLVFIAHSHGKFFKQMHEINNTERHERITHWVFTLFGFIAIGVILYGLYYARLQYFHSISGVNVSDPFSAGTNTLAHGMIFTKVAILMMANLAIYALGVVGSYHVHDKRPGYQEAYKKMQHHTKKLKKVYDELTKKTKKIREESK